MLVAVAPLVVTVILPETPAPTVAVSEVELLYTTDVAVTPPNLTTASLEKPAPVMATVFVVDCDVGVNEVIVGVSQVKSPVLVTVTPPVVTVILPEAPVLTNAVMEVELPTITDFAATPPNFTMASLPKLVPVIFTAWPGYCDEGVNEAIVGVTVLTATTLENAPWPGTAVLLGATM